VLGVFGVGWACLVLVGTGNITKLLDEIKSCEGVYEVKILARE